ncbi:MAG: prephenate dehydrogenase/arogenate dehydrogenase family protein [Steroidobacteraceae bacterium]
MNLDELRLKLNALDAQLLGIIAERQALGIEIARVKREAGLPTRDFRREREVLLRARENAAKQGISGDLGEAVMRLLIRGSLTTQEREQVAAKGQGSGRTALVIGGAGKMGRWFANFLAAQGYAVIVADPVGAVDGFVCLKDWRDDTLEQDIIVVATPIQIANEVLAGLAARKPRGVVFDLGSLKTPLRAGLTALREAGLKVTSVHPMFGPDTELLSGRHVIFIDMGNADALTVAQELFASTMAERVVMSLDEHDRLIAYVLGLSHALNISFFTALANSGEDARHLAALSSTTYDAQIDIATNVSKESPELYFEIQHLNEYGQETLKALRAAVEQVCNTVQAHDAAEFKSIMLKGREYLAGRVRSG